MADFVCVHLKHLIQYLCVYNCIKLFAHLINYLLVFEILVSGFHLFLASSGSIFDLVFVRLSLSSS